MEYLELLKNDKIGYYIALIVAALTAILQLLKKTSEYLEQFHVNRKLARYSALIQCCDASTQENKFLKSLKLMETFRIATGIITTPLKSKFIMMLYEHEIFTINELRQVHTFFTVSDNNKAIGNYSVSDKLEVLWSIMIVFSITILFLNASLPITPLKSIESLLAFIGIAAIYLLFGYGAGVPIRKARAYYKFKKLLFQKGLWEEASIQPSAQREVSGSTLHSPIFANNNRDNCEAANQHSGHDRA